MGSGGKNLLVDLLRAARFDAIGEMAAENKRLLSQLTALSYHVENLVAWRSVQAFGMAALRIVDGDAEYVRNHLRRQFWLVSDESGGIGWRAPELIGETLRRCPRRFDEFVSPLIYLLDIEEKDAPRFRSGTLWAIGRIAAGRPWVAPLALPLVLPCLGNADPQARGMALWCLGCLGYSGPIPDLGELLADPAPVEVYQEGDLLRTSVGALAEIGKV